MEMDTGNVDSKRQCLSGSSFIKLIAVSLILCMFLLANYNSFRMPKAKGRTELDQQKISHVTSKVQERVKNVTKVGKEERAGYTTVNMVLKADVTKYINKTNDNRDGERRPKVTNHYAEDGASYYVGTKYIMHKFLNDNGPRLSPKQRAQFVKERCQTFFKENNVRPYQNDRHSKLFISRLYNISVCYNLKVASTNTRRLLYGLHHRLSDDINRINEKTARHYGSSGLRPFHKVMPDKPRVNIIFVREPLERLLSAHRDNHAFKKKTFKEYLKLTLGKKMKKMNPHIYPYFEKCRPCEMQYDFVVRQNHFNDDIKIVLQEIGANGKVNIPERNKTGYNFASSDKLLQQYFRKIPNKLVHKLWVKYYKDYYIFGFPYPAHLMN